MSFLAQFTEHPEPAPNPTPAPSGWEPTPYAATALRNECEGVARAPEGTRNDTLNRAAYNLIQLVQGGQIPHDTVKVALIDAAYQAGLTAREIESTIRSGFAKGAHRARTPESRATPGAYPALNGPQAAQSAYMDLRALWDVEAPQEWLCEPLIAPGRQTVLYSAPKVGKSLLALQLVVAISQGLDTLGARTEKTHVLYLDFENDPIHDVRERLINMGHGPDAFDNVSYATYPTLPPLDTPEGAAHVARMIDETNAGLVVIDTIGRAVKGEENSNDTWLDLYRQTGLMLKRKGVALLRLDHSGKDEGRGQRGGSAKQGDVDLVWRMSEVVRDQSYRLDLEAQRMYVPEQSLVLRREQDPLGHHVDTRSSTQIRERAILDCLDQAGLPLSAGRDLARQALNAAGIKVRDTTLAAIIKKRKGAFDEVQ
jgi:hypothetical protein